MCRARWVELFGDGGDEAFVVAEDHVVTMGDGRDPLPCFRER
jgi:hypothetical protein